MRQLIVRYKELTISVTGTYYVVATEAMAWTEAKVSALAAAVVVAVAVAIASVPEELREA